MQRVALAWLVWVYLAAIAGAQGAATLTGSVLDPDAKVVADAAIVIRNEDTNAIRTAVTDRTGAFTVTDLTPGRYTLEVAVAGFELVRRTGVVVAVGQSETVAIR